MSRAVPFVVVFTIACAPEPHPDSLDQDGDGYIGFDDCDDQRADIYPNAPEVCDGIDNDCDGLVDDEDTYLDESTQTAWYIDADGDGFGDADSQILSCLAPSGAVEDDQDCDDTTADAHPDATEVCDDIDNDCDGLIDDADDSFDLDSIRTLYVDADGDGYGDPDQTVESCSLTSGVSESGDDCDDGDAELNPGASDTVGDDIDQDCDGLDGVDADGDGYASESSGGDDCDDSDSSVYTGAEDTVSDAIDQNCDGIDGVDADADGYASEDSGGDDCDDADADRNAGATDDVGDGVDQNCDDLDGVDADADGYASEASGGDDCDDTDYDVNPLAPEVDDDGIDSDCDGEDDNRDPDTADADGDGYSIVDGDCDDGNSAINPSATDMVGDGYDQNCDGIDGTDVDGDGYASEASGGGDCDDGNSDVNPDGVDELLADNDCDGVISDNGLSLADYSFVGENSDDWAGFSVASAGDVDGDGLDDLLVGAYGYDWETGKAYLILGASLGGSSEIDLTLADYSLVGENSNDRAGWSVSSAGDVDGDGLDDLFIGAFKNDEGGSDAGKAYLILGASLGGSSEIDLSLADYSFVGENSDDWAGVFVSSAGDVDGDGLDDLLVGATGNDDGGSDAGKAYLILGASLGSTSEIDLSLADYSFVGEKSDDYAGRSVSSAGDVDGDGLDDLFVGAFNNDDGGGHAGKAYLILGASLGSSSEIDLSLADYSFVGEDSDDYAGISVSSAGDVDGDGLDDLFVGAFNNDDGGSNAGKAYLILGASLGSTSEIDLSFADYSFVGENSDDYAGISVSSAGDVDGDGLDDLLVGASENDDNGSNAGKAYLILGASLSSTSDIDLADADYSFVGEYSDDYAGYSVTNVGDVNGDGLDDLVLGASQNDDGGLNAGKTYLILGGGP